MSEPAWIPIFASLSVIVSMLLAMPAVFLMVVSFASRRHPRPKFIPLRAKRVAVLMPAHNEAETIEATLTDLMASLDEGMTVWVVADNCTDDTARRAAELGANVIVRSDTERHGKGYAIECGVEAMSASPPEVVVIVDADCRIDPFSLRRIADIAHDKGRPAQAVYTMRPASDSLLSRVGAFAFAVRNVVRPMGMKRLGFPVHLAGTAMAFPYPLLRAFRGLDNHLVEDLYLGIELSLGGRAPILVEEARVESVLPTHQSAALAQRQRWEGGSLKVMKTHLLKVLREMLRYGRPSLLGLALDLTIPPLALFSLLISMNGAFALWLALKAERLFPFALSMIPAFALMAAVVSAYRAVGGAYLSAAELVRVPLYVLWKIPLYLGLMIRGAPRRWRRTERGEAK